MLNIEKEMVMGIEEYMITALITSIFLYHSLRYYKPENETLDLFFPSIFGGLFFPIVFILVFFFCIFEGPYIVYDKFKRNKE
jgi:hypothetical protein